MPIIPIYGHESLRRRVDRAVARQALPGSVLLQGARGIGKQRLALWIGQRLLCTSDAERPCGRCTACRYALDLVHPDLRWFFPRPRLTDPDAAAKEMLDDYAQAAAARAARHGLYAPPSGTDGLFVATVRAIVQLASYTPSLARRKVIVVGDAERMIPQEGAEYAANAFLKLLEEPPADTTIILTSSEPGALLPTIRSRVVALRAAPLAEQDVRAFLGDARVREALASLELPSSDDERLHLASGAPGRLLAAEASGAALAAARAFLSAVGGDRAARMRAVLALGGASARGFFSDVLDALTVLLHERARDAAMRDEPRRAVGAARAIEAVESAKMRAAGNVSPQLLGASIARELSEVLA